MILLVKTRMVSPNEGRMNMTRKIRSFPEVSIRAEVDRAGLYEELSPPWRLGLAGPTPPVDWDRAIFGGRKHRHIASVHRPKHDLKHAS
jgi:hypothetical protein